MTFTLEDDFQKDREPKQIYRGKLLVKTTADGSVNAVSQILCAQYLILGVFGSYMF